MLLNFLKTAFRNIFRQKVYSFINLLGLTIGITSFIIIFIYVQNELSYDKFFKESENLYRVGVKYNIDGVQFYSAQNPVPLAEGLRDEFSEIESVARMYNRYYSGGYTYVTYEDRQVKEQNLFWADSTVFKVMGIELIKGNPDEALRNENSVVITEETAKRYFGDEEAIGKILKFDDGFIYNVTGIVKSFPKNSHLHFDFLASLHTNKRFIRHPDWIDVKNYVYIRLKDNVDISQVEKQMHDFQKKYLEPEIKYITKLNYEDFIEKGNEFSFLFENVTDIHLKTIMDGNQRPQSDIKKVMVFGIIGLIVLLIACINFINITTAIASKRAKDVGIRKVVGSTKELLITQFLIETGLLVVFSVILSFFIIEQLVPVFNQILSLDLTMDVLYGIKTILVMLLLVIGVSLLAGFYPSTVLSSFKSVDVLKGKYSSGKKGRVFRMVLVIVQYSLSILLIISTLVIYLQIDFMQKKSLGFNPEDIVVVERPGRLRHRYPAFKEEIEKSPLVISSTSSYGAPQMGVETMVYFTKNKDVEESYTVVRFPSDFDFIDTYELEMVSGRKLDKKYSTDSTAVVVSETAIKVMGLTNPLEQEIYYSYEKDIPLKVVGVVKDFHSESLHSTIRPTIIHVNRDRPPMFYMVKYEKGKEKDVVKYLEEKWAEFLPGDVLQYKFLEDVMNTQYKKEFNLAKLILLFSCLALFVACLGLYGMSVYMATNRIKEFGIRKVLGAGATVLTYLMTKDMLKWVLFSNIIACPLGYYIMNKWLNNFSYKINLGIWIFVAAILVSFLIALITILYQTNKLIRTNPAVSLRDE